MAVSQSLLVSLYLAGVVSLVVGMVAAFCVAKRAKPRKVFLVAFIPLWAAGTAGLSLNAWTAGYRDASERNEIAAAWLKADSSHARIGLVKVAVLDGPELRNEELPIGLRVAVCGWAPDGGNIHEKTLVMERDEFREFTSYLKTMYPSIWSAKPELQRPITKFL